MDIQKFLKELSADRPSEADMRQWLGDGQKGLQNALLGFSDIDLWDQPLVTVKDLEDRGVDLSNPRIIKILDTNDLLWVPAFQLDSSGNAFSNNVLRVNERLDVAYDPERAAAWWYSPNEQLAGRTPVASLQDNTDIQSLLDATATL